MSPSSREREYARRRYNDWQKKQQQRAEARRRARRNAIAAIAAVAVLLTAVAVTLVLAGGDDQKVTTAAATPSAPPTASAGASAAASPSGGPNPCPKPPATQPQQPQSYTAPDAALAQHKSWTLTLTTSCGPVVISLDGAKAPKAVASTLFLVSKKFWNDTPCHRLTTSGIYVLQCGDPTGTGTGGPGYSYGPVENAPANDTYPAGTVAMARQGGNGSSMGSQFFLVYKDSTIPHDTAGGYTVMGKIVKGLDIVAKVAAGGSTNGDGAPNRPISILSTSVTPG